MFQKYALSVALFFLLVTSATSQIDSSQILLGGSFNIQNTTSNSGLKSSGVNVSVGKAFKQNTVYGIKLGYTYNTNDYITNTFQIGIVNFKEYNYSVGLFYRQYYPLSNKFNFFIEGGVNASYASQTTNTNYFDNTTGNSSFSKSSADVTNFQLYLSPGISYNLFKRLQVELTLPNFLNARYSHRSVLDNTTSLNDFNLNTGLNSSLLNNLGVGFHFILK